MSRTILGDTELNGQLIGSTINLASAPENEAGTLYTWSSASASGIVIDATSTGARTAIAFRNGNGRVGSVVTSGSGTSLVETSDYRLKENVVDVDQTEFINTVKQLRPVKYNFKTNPEMTCVGFIAHEAGEAIDCCCFGEKDAVDADGNISPQGIDQTKMIPYLVSVIQNLLERVETLESN